MAFQFVHITTYARKGRSFKDKSGKAKTSKGGATTASVFGEAQRQPEYSVHVETPKPPALVHGQELAKTEAEHDELTETLKDGQGRRIRSTQNTLLAGVASFPPDGRPEDFEKWKSLTVDFLKSEYGDALKTVVEHVDEKERHLHFFAFPDTLKAYDLHPGRTAKTEAVKAGKTPKEANAAYKDAMRAYQDRYFRAVGIPCGMARLGPARRRLSRDEWKTEQKAMGAVKLAIGVAIEARQKGHEADLRAAEAKEAAKQAQALAAEAIKAQDKAVAEARKATAWLKTVKGKAAAMIASAEDQVSKTRSFGGKLRSLFSGWMEASPEKLAKDLAKEKIAAIVEPLRDELYDKKKESRHLWEEKRKVEERLKNVSDNYAVLQKRVNSQSEELVRLRPQEPESSRLPSPKPFMR